MKIIELETQLEIYKMTSRSLKNREHKTKGLIIDIQMIRTLLGIYKIN